MKKFRIIVILLLMLLCVGCSQQGITEPFQEGSTQPPSGVEHAFRSYEDLEMWFKSDETGYIPAEEDLNQYGRYYDDFVRQMIQGDIKVPKVYIGEELVIPECKQEGYAPVFLDSEDVPYYMPWICYDILKDNKELVICISYLDEEEVTYAQGHTIDEFIRYIAPYESNVDDFKYSWILDVTVETIRFGNQETAALCIKKAAPHNSGIIFVYDNMCVRVYGVSSVLESMNWQEFSLRAE